MKETGTRSDSLSSNWPYVLALIPIMAAWACDRPGPADLRTAVVNFVSGLLTLAFVVVIQAQRRELEGFSITDKLTGVYNERHLRSELDRQVFLAHRAHLPFSLIFIDVDELKAVNDRYGHMTGNSVLRKLGGAMAGVIRQHMDYCFRFGGDEFVVLCPHTDLEAALPIAERVLAIPEGVGALKSKKITLSLGVAQLRGLESSDDLLTRADRAMYSVKKNGKNAIGTNSDDFQARVGGGHEQ